MIIKVKGRCSTHLISSRDPPWIPYLPRVPRLEVPERLAVRGLETALQAASRQPIVRRRRPIDPQLVVDAAAECIGLGLQTRRARPPKRVTAACIGTYHTQHTAHTQSRRVFRSVRPRGGGWGLRERGEGERLRPVRLAVKAAALRECPMGLNRQKTETTQNSLSCPWAHRTTWVRGKIPLVAPWACSVIGGSVVLRLPEGGHLVRLSLEVVYPRSRILGVVLPLEVVLPRHGMSASR